MVGGTQLSLPSLPSPMFSSSQELVRCSGSLGLCPCQAPSGKEPGGNLMRVIALLMSEGGCAFS